MPRAKLAKMAVEELKKEILRRTKVLPKLIAMRDALDKKIAKLQGLGAVKPITIARRKPGRRKAARRIVNRVVAKPGRAGSLSSALTEVLGAKGKLTVAEAAEAVLATGYKSKSKSFRLIVNQMLAKGPQFKRLGRGVYAVRG